MAEIEALFEQYKTGNISYEQYQDKATDIIATIIKKGEPLYAEDGVL